MQPIFWLVNDLFLKLWIKVGTFEWSILYLEGLISIFKKGTYKFEDQSFILQLTTKDNMTGYRSGIKLISKIKVEVLTIKSEGTLNTEKQDIYIRLQQNIKNIILAAIW